MEGFVDDEDVTMSISNFFSSNDVDLLSHARLKTSIFYVGGPEFRVVQLSEEHDHAGTTKTDHAQVDRLKGCISEMPTSYRTCLVSSIMHCNGRQSGHESFCVLQVH